jgi:hypothetical protein
MTTAPSDKGLFAEGGTGPTDPTRQHYRLAEAILGPGREL